MLRIFLIIALSFPVIGYGVTFKVLNNETGEIEYSDKTVDLSKYKILEIVEHKPTITSQSVSKEKSETSKGYYSSGELRYTYRYVDGKRNGITKEYYENGKHKADYTYKNNVIIDGMGFYETGELRYNYSYQNGKRHGETYEYDKEGALIATWIYKNGQLQ